MKKINLLFLYEQNNENCCCYIPTIRQSAMGMDIEDAKFNALELVPANLDESDLCDAHFERMEVSGKQYDVLIESSENDGVICYLPNFRLGGIGRDVKEAKENALKIIDLQNNQKPFYKDATFEIVTVDSCSPAISPINSYNA
ncbi:hypothetical protein [Paenibacillus polymyxa]|uniref:hypothetical protein n=1 Tax=Paenibacillus polymyxa TaxID=1406 RepID=UPI0005CED510|nr:hypothetical protein [Paenibacillus polymyxa]KJD38106.1 hypothetical protein QD46_21570 [Paenibacillus polymyxa]MBE3650787.1 hypothetical protein [Paenibacillus polymyxa]MBY7740293.1 hypothetical protein [Paenibacillus polymyxa]MEE4580989.1 hypothetical protein [Paenibacillus polymyxa]